MALGLQVIIEDYIHQEGMKIASSCSTGSPAGASARRRASHLRMLAAETGMTAYNIVDHTFDVVVVGAGGAGLRATLECAAARPEDRLHHQGVPHPQPHRGGAGRRLGLARQHGRGQLALAHVRHRQGFGLAGRPGRHRISLPQRAGSRVRAGAFRHALLRAPRKARSTSAPLAA